MHQYNVGIHYGIPDSKFNTFLIHRFEVQYNTTKCSKNVSTFSFLLHLIINIGWTINSKAAPSPTAVETEEQSRSGTDTKI